MSARHKELLLALVRIGLGGIFLYAAGTKVPNMELFAEETANYRLLPAELVSLFTAAIVGVELVAGAMLVLGAAARASATVIGALLVSFTLALTQALLRGIDLRCGCFGGTEPATWATVVRDLAMLAACYPLIRFGGGRLLPRSDAPAPAA